MVRDLEGVNYIFGGDFGWHITRCRYPFYTLMLALMKKHLAFVSEHNISELFSPRVKLRDVYLPTYIQTKLRRSKGFVLDRQTAARQNSIK